MCKSKKINLLYYLYYHDDIIQIVIVSLSYLKSVITYNIYFFLKIIIYYIINLLLINYIESWNYMIKFLQGFNVLFINTFIERVTPHYGAVLL